MLLSLFTIVQNKEECYGDGLMKVIVNQMLSRKAGLVFRYHTVTVYMIEYRNAHFTISITIVLFQSFPRSIWLSDTAKQLVQWPVEEIKKLRTKQVSIAKRELKGGTLLEVPTVTASQVCEFDSL